jgi:hypothetical protein
LEPEIPPLEEKQVAVYPLMDAPPSLAGAPKLTMIEPIPTLVDTAVGALGIPTITAFDGDEGVPAPAELLPVTLHV